MVQDDESADAETIIINDLTKAERKLSGNCPDCDSTGYTDIWINGQVSNKPYKTKCNCPLGDTWSRKFVRGFK